MFNVAMTNAVASTMLNNSRHYGGHYVSSNGNNNGKEQKGTRVAYLIIVAYAILNIILGLYLYYPHLGYLKDVYKKQRLEFTVKDKLVTEREYKHGRICTTYWLIVNGKEGKIAGKTFQISVEPYTYSNACVGGNIAFNMSLSKLRPSVVEKNIKQFIRNWFMTRVIILISCLWILLFYPLMLMDSETQYEIFGYMLLIGGCIVSGLSLLLDWLFQLTFLS